MTSVIMGITSCKSSQPEINQTTLLIQLYEDSAVQVLENNFKDYKLAKEKIVSRPTKIYLFTFDSQKITDTELIKLLKASDLVKEAQQNRTIQTRNNK